MKAAFVPCCWIALLGCSAEPSPSSDAETSATTGATSTTSSESGSAETGSSSGGSRDEGTTGTQSCTAPSPASSVDVMLPTPTGVLHGTWMTPEGCAPFPTVIFHVGSGPTDRDGNQSNLHNDGHLQLAQGLQSAGYASLRFDKRGIAASSDAVEQWRDIVLETFVDDLSAWIELLDSQDDQVSTITLAGHSEGGLISTMAARQTEVDALILLAAPGRRLSDILRTQLEQNLANDPDLLMQALAIIEELENGNTVEMVPAALLQLFHPDVQPFLISTFARDPAEELAQVDAPVLIIAGEADIQVPPSEADVLVAAKPDAQLVVLEGMTHTLKDVAMGQQAAYTDPSVPLAPGLLDAVTAFLAR